MERDISNVRPTSSVQTADDSMAQVTTDDRQATSGDLSCARKTDVSEAEHRYVWALKVRGGRHLRRADVSDQDLPSQMSR
jgi:hypothetical protein